LRGCVGLSPSRATPSSSTGPPRPPSVPPEWFGAPQGGRRKSEERFPCIGRQCVEKHKWHPVGTPCQPYRDLNMVGTKCEWQHMCAECADRRLGEWRWDTYHDAAEVSAGAGASADFFDEPIPEGWGTPSKQPAQRVGVEQTPPFLTHEQQRSELGKPLWLEVADSIPRAQQDGGLAMPTRHGVVDIDALRRSFPALPYIKPAEAFARAAAIINKSPDGIWTPERQVKARACFEVEAANVEMAIFMPEVVAREELLADERFQVTVSHPSTPPASYHLLLVAMCKRVLRCTHTSAAREQAAPAWPCMPQVWHKGKCGVKLIFFCKTNEDTEGVCILNPKEIIAQFSLCTY
jgi:hypothetical protein